MNDVPDRATIVLAFWFMYALGLGTGLMAMRLAMKLFAGQ